jgi:hypothetical protein
MHLDFILNLTKLDLSKYSAHLFNFRINKLINKVY